MIQRCSNESYILSLAPQTTFTSSLSAFADGVNTRRTMSSMLKAPKTARRNQVSGQTVEESAGTLYVRSRNFIETNQTKLIGLAVVLGVVLIALVAFLFMQRSKANTAADHLAEVLAIYESGNFEQALAGSGNVLGLEALALDYSRSPAGKLAAFYAGQAHFQLANYEEADRFFARYSGDKMLESSALAARAAAAESREDYAQAARYYEQAARMFSSLATTPDQLMGAARNYEAAGNISAAHAAYERILKDYPESQVASGTVPVLIARLDAQSSN